MLGYELTSCARSEISSPDFTEGDPALPDDLVTWCLSCNNAGPINIEIARKCVDNSTPCFMEGFMNDGIPDRIQKAVNSHGRRQHFQGPFY